MRRLKILSARLKIIVRLILYVVIIWGFFKVTYHPSWYLKDNIFTSYPNKYLELEGYDILSTEQVLNKLQQIDLPDKPIYLIDTNKIKENLEELAPVKRVIIRRYWLPSRLRIVIDERTPAISIAPNKKVKSVAVFTLDGANTEILERKYLPLPKYERTYKVLTYDDYNQWSPHLIPYLKKMAKYLEAATGEKITYLDIRNPDDVYAQMKNFRLRIGALKGNEVFSRIKKVASVIPETQNIDNINYIDLRWNNVSIKLKDEKK